MSALRSAVLWIALAVGLSASLADLASHVASAPWARASVLFAALFAYCAATEPGPRRPGRAGLPLLVLGLAVSLLGVAGGMTRAGRPGIAIAMIGLARTLGIPRWPRALLAAWIVPVPSGLQAAFAPGLAGLVAAAAVAAGAAFGIDASIDASRFGRLVLVTPQTSLDLLPPDAGLPLAWTLAGLGWFAVVRTSDAMRAAVRRALFWALAAIPLQVAALAVACGAALAGAGGVARSLLDHVVVIAAVVGLGVALRGERRWRASAHPGIAA